LSIANYFTFIRIFISPIFLLIYIEHKRFDISDQLLPYILLFLLGVSELSDAFDGYIALDPMADSIYRTSVFLTFTIEPIKLPMLLIFVFLYRDSVVSTLRTICALKGFALAARRSGKIKAVIQAIAAFMVLGLMIPHSLGYLSLQELRTLSTGIVSFAAAYAFFSGVDYIYANRSYIKLLLTLPGKAT
jgi:CDP-diacylglycerol--glycerol-3-phosphate 3-phosphatidyltransferase